MRRRMGLVIASLVMTVSVFAGVAIGKTLDSRKVKLPRDDVYYDIVNDAGDGGNFMLQIHVPVPGGKKVYCLIYKDHTNDGTMGGMSCDWQALHMK